MGTLGTAGAKKERTDLYGDPLPACATYRIGTVRFRQAHVWRVAFSPDGKTIASGGRDHEVRLWDPETGRTVRRFRGHPESINCVAFSPDGKRLASGSALGKMGGNRLHAVGAPILIPRKAAPGQIVGLVKLD
jgi:hypothetical protein